MAAVRSLMNGFLCFLMSDVTLPAAAVMSWYSTVYACLSSVRRRHSCVMAGWLRRRQTPPHLSSTSSRMLMTALPSLRFRGRHAKNCDLWCSLALQLLLLLLAEAPRVHRGLLPEAEDLLHEAGAAAAAAASAAKGGGKSSY